MFTYSRQFLLLKNLMQCCLYPLSAWMPEVRQRRGCGCVFSCSGFLFLVHDAAFQQRQGSRYDEEA